MNESETGDVDRKSCTQLHNIARDFRLPPWRRNIRSSGTLSGTELRNVPEEQRSTEFRSK